MYALVSNTEEVDRATDVAKSTGRILAPLQNKPFAPDFEQVKKVIDSGKLGRIVQVRMAMHGFSRRWDWQTLREFGGDELNNTGPHPIDHS